MPTYNYAFIDDINLHLTFVAFTPSFQRDKMGKNSTDKKIERIFFTVTESQGFPGVSHQTIFNEQGLAFTQDRHETGLSKG